MSEPPIQCYPKRAVWLFVGLVVYVSASLAATAVFQKWNSFLWMLMHILGSAGMGTAIAWSMGWRGYASSGIGGALGCAILLGGWLLVGPWLIARDPELVDEFGGGIGSAIARIAFGMIIGGIFGSPVGFLAEFCRRLSIRK